MDLRIAVRQDILSSADHSCNKYIRLQLQISDRNAAAFCLVAYPEFHSFRFAVCKPVQRLHFRTNRIAHSTNVACNLLDNDFFGNNNTIQLCVTENFSKMFVINPGDYLPDSTVFCVNRSNNGISVITGKCYKAVRAFDALLQQNIAAGRLSADNPGFRNQLTQRLAAFSVFLYNSNTNTVLLKNSCQIYRHSVAAGDHDIFHRTDVCPDSYEKAPELFRASGNAQHIIFMDCKIALRYNDVPFAFSQADQHPGVEVLLKIFQLYSCQFTARRHFVFNNFHASF